MKKNSLAAWPTTLSENSLTAYSSSYSRRQRSGMIKLLPSPPEPPTEETIAAMNELASKHPFCRHYKAKRNDTL